MCCCSKCLRQLQVSSCAHFEQKEIVSSFPIPWRVASPNHTSVFLCKKAPDCIISKFTVPLNPLQVSGWSKLDEKDVRNTCDPESLSLSSNINACVLALSQCIANWTAWQTSNQLGPYSLSCRPYLHYQYWGLGIISIGVRRPRHQISSVLRLLHPVGRFITRSCVDPNPLNSSRRIELDGFYVFTRCEGIVCVSNH